MPASRAVLRAKSSQMEASDVVFANDKARIAWEVGQEVSKLTPELPVETPTMAARTISFDSAHRTRGTYAIFVAGTVIGTAEFGVFVVPERTLTILRKLDIPYKERV